MGAEQTALVAPEMAPVEVPEPVPRRFRGSRFASSRTGSGCAGSTRCASGSCGASGTASPGCGSPSATPAAASRRSAWEDAEGLYALCAGGTPVCVTGVFESSERWGAKIKIAELRPAEPHEYEPTTWRPVRGLARAAGGATCGRCWRRSRTPARQLLDRFFGEDCETWERFRDAPAAKVYHQAYRHGLLEHTLSVAQAVTAAANFFPGIDRDVAVTGALLHDIGKIVAYNDDPLAIDLTDAGRLQGEIPLGYYTVRRADRAHPGLRPRPRPVPCSTSSSATTARSSTARRSSPPPVRRPSST